MVMGGLENVATMHLPIQESRTPELTLSSATTATGIWAMEDWLVFADGRELHGAGHYHETYMKQDGNWRISSLHLTRTIQEMSGEFSMPENLSRVAAVGGCTGTFAGQPAQRI